MVNIKSDKSIIIIFIGLLAFISLYWYTYNNRQNTSVIEIVHNEKTAEVNEKNIEEVDTQKQEVKMIKRVDLNKANVQELSDIIYISDEQAQLIVDYRNENGEFESVDGVVKIKGINHTVCSMLKKYAYVLE